jgi:hypothetical protein
MSIFKTVPLERIWIDRFMSTVSSATWDDQVTCVADTMSVTYINNCPHCGRRWEGVDNACPSCGAIAVEPEDNTPPHLLMTDWRV